MWRRVEFVRIQLLLNGDKNADQLLERYIKIKVIKYCVDGRYTVRKELLSSD